MDGDLCMAYPVWRHDGCGANSKAKDRRIRRQASRARHRVEQGDSEPTTEPDVRTLSDPVQISKEDPLPA